MRARAGLVALALAGLLLSPGRGPAAEDVTRQVQDEANLYLKRSLAGVKRVPLAQALRRHPHSLFGAKPLRWPVSFCSSGGKRPSPWGFCVFNVGGREGGDGFLP